MKKLFFVSYIVFAGCNAPQPAPAPEKRADSLVPPATVHLSPERLLADSADLHFTDKGSFWMMYFREGLACMDYYPQCGSCFKTDIRGQTIRLYWNTALSGKACVDLDARFKDVASPKPGEVFAELRVADDSHFMVSYHYQAWIDSMNAREARYIDTLFPRWFERMD